MSGYQRVVELEPYMLQDVASSAMQASHGTHSKLARSAMSNNNSLRNVSSYSVERSSSTQASRSKARDTPPHPNRVMGGEVASQPLRVEVDTTEGEDLSSDPHVGVAAIARSSRPKVVQVAKYTKSHSSHLVGNETATQSARPNIRNPEDTEPYSNRRVGAQATSSIEAKDYDYYDAVVDLLDDYHDGVHNESVGFPFPEYPRGNVRPPLLSTLLQLPELTDDYDDMYHAVIKASFVDSPVSSSSSQPEVPYEVPSPDALLRPLPSRTQPSHNSTTSYIRNDYGAVSANVGSTLRVVNNPPVLSGVDPDTINLSNRNSVPFPSLPTVETAELLFRTYNSVRGDQRQHNRASNSTIDTIFGNGARPVHQSYRNRRTPLALWLTEFLVAPAEELLERIKKVPKVESIRKTVRSLKGPPKKAFEVTRPAS